MSANTETVKPSFQDKLKSFHSWAGVDDSNLNEGQKLAVKYFMDAVILFIFQVLFVTMKNMLECIDRSSASSYNLISIYNIT